MNGVMRPFEGGKMSPWRRLPLLLTFAGAFALAGCGGPQGASSAPGGFAICATCHSTEAGENRVGPTLYELAGRRAGAIAGFAYSPAIRDSDIVWTREALDRFLADPRGTIPGNRMAFAGIADDARRRQVVDYLMSLGAEEPKEGQ